MWDLLLYILLGLVIVLFVKVSNLSQRLLKLEKRFIVEKTPVLVEKTKTVAPGPQVGTVATQAMKNEQPSKSQPLKHYTADKKAYLEQFFRKTAIYFSTGNIIAKLGVIILFFGIIFLLKYATDHHMLPLNLRLIAAATLAVVLVVTGWFIYPKKKEYGLTLQGCGIGILYITCFISYRLYHLLPPNIALILLIFIGVLTASIALLQNSLTLILFAQLGGFITPILAASPNGSEFSFFSYYAILNSSIAIIAWFKAWRALNIIGFVFTFVLAGAWGFWQYQPQHYLQTQNFLIFYTVLYTIITVLFSRQQQLISPKYFLDNILLFGVPLISFSIQVCIAPHGHLNLALSALGYGVFYTAVAIVLLSINKLLYKLLSETYLYITYVFFLMAILLASSQQWLGLFWALASLPLLIMGIRTERVVARFFGQIVLSFTTIVYLLCFYVIILFETTSLYFINGAFIGLISMAASVLVSNNKCCHILEKTIFAPLLIFTGTISWFVFSFSLFYTHHHILYGLLYFILFSWVWYFFSRKLQANYCEALTALIFPITLGYLLLSAQNFSYVSWSTGLIWGAALINLYGLLRLADKFEIMERFLSGLHACTYGLLTVTLCALTIQLLRFNLHLSIAWQSAISGLIPLLAVGVIMFGVKKSIWPFKVFPALYQQTICAVILSTVYLWCLVANFFLWNFQQHMLYIPLLNPIDLMMAFSLTTMLYWLYIERLWLKNTLRITPTVIISLLVTWVFVWISTITIRSVHYWADVPYQFDTMLHSTVAQTSLTIVWCLISLIIVALATWRYSKAIWWLGMIILGITILKLFFVDLANSNTISRIISFIGVGLVLLLIGYFSPVFGTAKSNK